MPRPTRGRHLRLFAVPRERLADRRIDGTRPAAAQPELLRLEHQPMAVERDVRGGVVGAREKIRPELLGPIVPDLGPIQREHDRLARALREQHGQLRQQPVAVHMDDVRARDARRQRLPYSPRGERGPEQRKSSRAGSRSAVGNQVDRAGQRARCRARAADARRTRPRPRRRGTSCPAAMAAARWRPGRVAGAA